MIYFAEQSVESNHPWMKQELEYRSKKFWINQKSVIGLSCTWASKVKLGIKLESLGEIEEALGVFDDSYMLSRFLSSSEDVSGNIISTPSSKETE